MTKFEVGKKYIMRSICDHNCTWEYEVTARTAQTITLADTFTHEVIKCRVNKQVSEWSNTESIFPLGRYSMAPILRAENAV